MPKVIDRNRRRQEFAEAAGARIAAHGIAGLRMREVADEAGYSPGLIAHYFRDQQDLLTETYRCAYRRQAGRFLVAAGGKEEGLAALEKTLLSILPTDNESDLDWRIRLAYAETHRAWPEIAEIEHSSQSAFLARLETLLREARERGELRPEIDTLTQAHTLSALVTGLTTNHHFDPGEFTRERIVAIARDHLHSLATAGKRTHRAQAREEARIP